MVKSLLTRRSFVKLAAVVGAAAGLAATPHQALAETGGGGAAAGVKVVRTCCRACGKKRMRRAGDRAERARREGGGRC